MSWGAAPPQEEDGTKRADDRAGNQTQHAFKQPVDAGWHHQKDCAQNYPGDSQTDQCALSPAMMLTECARHAQRRQREKRADPVNQIDMNHHTATVIVAIPVAGANNDDENGDNGERKNPDRPADSTEVRMRGPEANSKEAGSETIESNVRPAVLIRRTSPRLQRSTHRAPDLDAALEAHH